MLNRFRLRTLVARGSFAWDVGTLATGTVVSQSLTILALLVLARIYSPEQFGVFGLFMSVMTVLGFVACAGYERAIVLPERDADGARLLVLSWIIAAGVAVAVWILVLLGGSQFSSWVRSPDLAAWLVIVPLGVFLAAFGDTLRYWMARAKMFGPVARSRVAQVVLGSGLQIGLGSSGMGAGGLIVGRLSGIALLGLLLVRTGWARLTAAMRGWDGRADLARIARRYSKFPKFVAPSILLLQAAQIFPVFLIAANFSESIVGFMAMVMRVVSAPLQVAGSAFEHVFLQRGAAEMNESGTTRDSVELTLASLLLMAAIPGVLLVLLGRQALTLLLGAEWELAGSMAVWMSPIIVLNFIVTPLGPVFNIAERQELYTGLQEGRVVLSLATVFLVGSATGDITYTILAYAGAESLYFLVLLAVVLRLSGATVRGVIGRMVGIGKRLLSGGTSPPVH